MKTVSRGALGILLAAGFAAGQETIVVIDDFRGDTTVAGSIESIIESHAAALDSVYCAFGGCGGPDTVTVEIHTDSDGRTADVFIKRSTCRAITDDLARAIRKWELGAFRNGEILYAFTFSKKTSCAGK